MAKMYPVAGCKLYIGDAAIDDQDDDFDAADFDAVSWTEVKGWVTMGAIGDTAQLVTSDQIGVARTKKAKGNRNAGSMENVFDTVTDSNAWQCEFNACGQAGPFSDVFLNGAGGWKILDCQPYWSGWHVIDLTGATSVIISRNHNDSDGLFAKSIPQPGRITAAPGATTITGTGTSFTDLSPGDVILFERNQRRTVDTITSDTEMTVTAALTRAAENNKFMLFNGTPHGTVSVTAGTKTVTGVGTLFTEQVGLHEQITIAGERHWVAWIDSDTSLTLFDNHSAGASGVSFTVDYSRPCGIALRKVGFYTGPLIITDNIIRADHYRPSNNGGTPGTGVVPVGIGFFTESSSDCALIVKGNSHSSYLGPDGTPTGNEVAYYFASGSLWPNAQFDDTYDNIYGTDAFLDAVANFDQSPTGTYTPAPYFATAGDSAPTSVTASAMWVMKGDICVADIEYYATMNYTTSSGAFRINLPFTATSEGPFYTGSVTIQRLEGITRTASREQFVGYVARNTDYLELAQIGSNTVQNVVTAGNMPSGRAIKLNLHVEYRVQV